MSVIVSHETYIDQIGKCAETQVELGGNRVLTIATSKRYDKRLTTSVKMQKREGAFLCFKMYEDFSKQLETTTARCTIKNLTEQHHRNIEDLEAIAVEALAHYK